jgi:dUTP pyrophosphatase
MFKVQVLKDGCLPTKAHNGDAGFDVYSASDLDIMIGPGERYKFPVGIAIELPLGFMALVQGKSGLAAKDGITTIGNVIDSGYRGQVHAILLNTSQVSITIKPRQKLAQLIVIPCYTDYVFEVVNTLTESTRGADGFGSTGL